MILASAVLSQYTRVTDRRQQTTTYRNSETCNAIATFCQKSIGLSGQFALALSGIFYTVWLHSLPCLAVDGVKIFCDAAGRLTP